MVTLMCYIINYGHNEKINDQIHIGGSNYSKMTTYVQNSQVRYKKSQNWKE